MGVKKLTVRHDLSVEDAQERLAEGLVDALQEAFPSTDFRTFKQHWGGSSGEFTFRIKGRNVSGTMSLNQSSMFMEIQLPRGAGFFIDVDETMKEIKSAISDLLN